MVLEDKETLASDEPVIPIVYWTCATKAPHWVMSTPRSTRGSHRSTSPDGLGTVFSAVGSALTRALQSRELRLSTMSESRKLL